jgi:hypothetical protein
MSYEINRRQLIQLASACGLCCGLNVTLVAAPSRKQKLISPGCRTSKVKVAKLYIGIPNSHYPNPAMDLRKDIQDFEAAFADLKKGELSDVDFIVDEFITSVDQLKKFKDKLKQADGILAIHLSLFTMPMFNEILSLKKPTMVFAAPYSGHEWYTLSFEYKKEGGHNLQCIFTSDYTQLAAAIRPFRAIHHLREAKILNITTTPFENYSKPYKEKFGTEIKQLTLPRVIAAYEAVTDKDAQKEADIWIKGALEVVEPSKEEIFKSCKLTLAFERIMDEENATVITADCYGSVFESLCQAYAYPCIAFTKLNDMGLGGVCQSDLPCAMTHILFQGLCGRPGFVNNPGFDFVDNTAVLIHCLGTRKMDGPAGPSAPYKLRSIMEREEGAVPQVMMRTGQKVTQAVISGVSQVLYFTGTITGTPESDRGCRTKITVDIDGSSEKLWQNWSDGIHRVTLNSLE